jgi:hypothetical protein
MDKAVSGVALSAAIARTRLAAARSAAGSTLTTVGRIAMTVAVGTFVFRLLDARFHNEHIELMSGGRQILVYGELPFRDWLDPGRFLSYYLSAAVQLLFGYNMLGEALMASALIGIGAGLTFLLAARASGSVTIGLFVTALSVVIYPRLYNSYKIVLPVLGLYLCWRYADKRDWVGLVLIGVATAIAALTRPDFGLYVGAAALTVLCLVHYRDGVRRGAIRTAAYVASVGLVLLPFLVYLDLNGGVEAYYRVAYDFGQREKAVLTDMFAFSGPAVVVDTISLELPLLGSIALPGLFEAGNANAWLFYLFSSLPIGALVVLGARYGSGRRMAEMPSEGPKILSAIVLSGLAIRVLLPHASLSRLGDVGPLAAVIGAWLIAQLVGDPIRGWEARARAVGGAGGTQRTGLRRGRGAVQWARLAGAALIASITAFSVVTVVYGEFKGDGSFGKPLTLLRRAPTKLAELTTSPPIEEWSKPDSEGLRAAVRYVRDCTTPKDRVFVTVYRPEMVFYSGRGFAGGVPFMLGDHFSSPETQEQIVRKLDTQRVPIVIAEAKGFAADGEFSKRQPVIRQYLTTRYEVGGATTFGANGGETYLVLVDRSLAPSGSYSPYSLPCYR